MTCKSSASDAPGKFKSRYPEPHVPHARRTIGSLVATEAKRAVYYRVTKEDVHYNVRGIAATFEPWVNPQGSRRLYSVTDFIDGECIWRIAMGREGPSFEPTITVNAMGETGDQANRNG